jgi:hypothetical protein
LFAEEKQIFFIRYIHQLEEEVKKLREENILLRKELETMHQHQLPKEESHSSTVERKCQTPICEEEVSRLLKHPYLERLIGISKKRFKEYLHEIRPMLSNLNAKGEYRQYQTSRQIERSDKVHLFLTLYWLRQYPTVVNFETIFGVPS